MNNTDVPIWEKYTLTIEEASKYFRIGEKKLRKLAEENLDAGWVIVNGCNLVRRTEKGRLRRRGWGLRWEKAQKGGKGTNLRGFFED